MELYKKYRPTRFQDVVGQREAVAQLVDLGKRNAIPHTILFVGGSGTGKTTMARILRIKLKCADSDFIELNGADFRGIDTVRDIIRQAGSAPMGGPCRVWLVDEAHQLTPAAADSFLKLLEDTPKHVYFFLATTDPKKLKRTIVTRCTEIVCKPISASDLEKLVVSVAEKEKKPISGVVSQRIAEVSDGSARKALVLLHALIGLEDESAQLQVIESADVKRQAIEIARALMGGKTDWKAMAGILKNVDEDAESLRRMILGYSKAVLLNSGSARAAMIIEEFRDPFFDASVGSTLLALGCWNVIKGG